MYPKSEFSENGLQPVTLRAHQQSANQDGSGTTDYSPGYTPEEKFIWLNPQPNKSESGESAENLT